MDVSSFEEDEHKFSRKTLFCKSTIEYYYIFLILFILFVYWIKEISNDINTWAPIHFYQWNYKLLLLKEIFRFVKQINHIKSITYSQYLLKYNITLIDVNNMNK